MPVPARKLDPRWRDALKLEGDVVLDDALVLRINAHGPLTTVAAQSDPNRDRLLKLAARATGRESEDG